jgi:hypothetical protein
MATVFLVLVFLYELGTAFWTANLDARRFVFLPSSAGKVSLLKIITILGLS